MCTEGISVSSKDKARNGIKGLKAELYLDASVCQVLKQRFPHQQTAGQKTKPSSKEVV